PVGAVRRLAARDEPGELGAVVGLARVLEGLPDELAVLPAAGVVELEMDLADLRRAGAVPRVDRARGEEVGDLPAHGVRDHCRSLGVDAELDARGVARDQLRGA